MFSAGQDDFHAALHFLTMAQMNVSEQVVNPSEQIVLLVRFSDEVVGATLQTLKDVLGVGEGGEQNHGELGRLIVGTDAAAQFVAVHFWHGDVRNDQSRFVPLQGIESLAAIARSDDMEVVLLEHVLQLLSLSGAVFNDKDFEVSSARFWLHGFVTMAVNARAMPSGGNTSLVAPSLIACPGMP